MNSKGSQENREAILEVRELNKSFGGLKAIDDVTFALQKGCISALIGPNGAGKTTLLNLISGMEKPDSGHIYFLGRNITGEKTWAITGMGVCRTFQAGRIFQKMTVLENVLTGIHTRARSGWLSGMFHLPRERKEEKELEIRAFKLIEHLGLTDVVYEQAGNISLILQRKLEIARALASEPKLLLLDEPVAGLNMRETEELGSTIKNLLVLGVTILLVEHDMNLVMDLADRIVVLQHGQKIAEGTTVEIRNDPKVISAYLGSE